MSSISLKNLYHRHNAFGDRNISLNLRNVGAKRYVFGITLLELVWGGLVAIFLTMLGGLKFVFLGFLVWGYMYGLRVILKPFFFSKWIYKSKLKKSYFWGVEHHPSFHWYLKGVGDVQQQ